MKLARIALVLLMTVALAGAAYGAAASFTVNSPGLGAGDTIVVACDTTLSVSFGPVEWEEPIGPYKVTTVTVSGIDQSLPLPRCRNGHFRMQLTKADGSVLGDEVDDSDIGTTIVLGFDFSDQVINAGEVAFVHIAMYGP